jgi:hypothetical protein
MGSRDDSFIDDERADALMRRLLARGGELEYPQPPRDLVTRTSRRLPPEPPELAARLAVRRRRLRLLLSAALVGATALVALVGLAGMLAGQPQLALIFGDGTSGLSRVLLTLHLLAKPIVHSVGAIGAPLLLVGALLLAAGGWLWRRLLLQPAYASAEKRP